jgi:hypothetical protein
VSEAAIFGTCCLQKRFLETSGGSQTYNIMKKKFGSTKGML